MRRLIEIRDRILDVLVAASRRRNEFAGTGWIEYERAMMLEATNLNRLGSDPITREQIERVETMACGHIDYASKFALYCAELAIHGPTRRVEP